MKRVARSSSRAIDPQRFRLLVGMSGASGAIYAIRLLEVLRDIEHIETHLIMTPAAQQTIALETSWSVAAVKQLADFTYHINDIAAPPSSGSYPLDAMVVIPCSMRTLAHVAYSLSDNLLLRAADVALKERRPLVLMPRETPLHLGHLRLLVQVAEIGAIVVPPTPAFYHQPRTIDDLINQTVNRLLDVLAIRLPADLFERWPGGKARAHHVNSQRDPAFLNMDDSDGESSAEIVGFGQARHRSRDARE
jgi:flavin prenyltransferase